MELSDFEARRISIYLAGLDLAAPRADGGEDHAAILCGASETRRHIRRRYPARFAEGEFRGVYGPYIGEAQALFRAIDPDAVFAVFPGDSRRRFVRPTIVKSRLVADRDCSGVLLPLDRARHWGEVALVPRHDIAFRDKDDRMVWRGVTTGVFHAPGPGRPYSSRFHVATLPATHPAIDVFYSGLTQVETEGSDLPLELLRTRVRPPLSMADQLRAKFIVSLEGNDVATGLKWMLFSNSAVVMPPPTCETWACEGDLVPYEHYIPLRDDLSDLEAVHDWCMTHLSDCEEIARNGRSYIERFLDPAREAEIAGRVIRAYLARTDLTLDFGPAERAMQRLRHPGGLLRRGRRTARA